MFLTIVIPLRNEAGNLRKLYLSLLSVLEPLNKSFEIIFVDDGSADSSFGILEAICSEDGRVHALKFKKHFGQAQALAAGFDHARGDIVVTMDADLQHDPVDIPSFLEKIEAGYDLVCGWKKIRSDSFFSRRIPSWTANAVIRHIFKINIHDCGTTFKAYRRDILKNLRLCGGIHRFIPVLLNASGARITEIPIRYRKRESGRSHYGLSRAGRVLLDIFYVYFFLRYPESRLRVPGKSGHQISRIISRRENIPSAR